MACRISLGAAETPVEVAWRAVRNQQRRQSRLTFVRERVSVLFIVLLVAGCGSVPPPAPTGSGGGLPSASGHPPPSPAPVGSTSRSPAPAHTLTTPGTVTFADSGYTVLLRRGERLKVYLSEVYGSWDAPRERGRALQRTEASGGYPSRRPTLATFLAVKEGTATITARTDYRCLHARPRCAVAQTLWLLRVIVSG